MTSEELARALAEFELNKARLALLLGVTPRAVNLWLAGEREVPGPVVAYLRLLRSSPKSVQAQEFAILRQEDPKMYEGMYSFAFTGREGSGVGAFVLAGGRAYGSDGGIMYDGRYQPSTSRRGYLDVYFRLTIPPGVALVTGVPTQPAAYSFDIQASIAARGQTPMLLQTPYGPVEVVVTFLREVPHEIAA